METGPGRLECHGVETRSLRGGGGVISHVLLVVASTVRVASDSAALKLEARSGWQMQVRISPRWRL